jgi:hypothetical protein
MGLIHWNPEDGGGRPEYVGGLEGVPMHTGKGTFIR